MNVEYTRRGDLSFRKRCAAPVPFFPALRNDDTVLLSSERFWDFVYLITENLYRERAIESADTLIERLLILVNGVGEGMTRYFLIKRHMGAFNFYQPAQADASKAVFASWPTYQEATAVYRSVVSEGQAPTQPVMVARDRSQCMGPDGYVLKHMFATIQSGMGGSRLLTMVSTPSFIDPGKVLGADTFDTTVRETALRALNALYLR